MPSADAGRDPRSGAADPRTTEQIVEPATCLGCGCCCDDIAVAVRDGRIANAGNACALGSAWFGDGRVPAATRVDGRATSIDAAVDAIAGLVRQARLPLVYLAPELSCEAQREAIALADLLHASLETVTTSTVMASIVAAQERGRAAATLGEVRNRADVVLFWGVDPDERYPRYRSRYAPPSPASLHVAARTVIAVDVGDRRGPADADVRVAVPASDELATLTALEAIVRRPATAIDGPLWTRARDLAERLTAAKYAVIVADAEPPDVSSPRPAAPALSRAGALISLSQALNGPTRCALSTLRAGGNRSGADAALTAQTGYPMAVSFAPGFPTYRPFDRHAADVVVIVGAGVQIPASVTSTWLGAAVAAIGPHASAYPDARIAIDTGMAGIHHGGTAVRMDDIPLPLRPSLEGPADPVHVLRRLITRLATVGGAEAPALRSSRRAGSSDRPSPNAGSGR
jgi:formylmethanofuran dehydrogenase subunit B